MAMPATRSRHPAASNPPKIMASKTIKRINKSLRRGDFFMTTITTPIASLSIAARATLNMHSLNNEGGEGNQIQTRMVEIVGHDGQLHSVNAISGDMLKHVLMEHFFR